MALAVHSGAMVCVLRTNRQRSVSWSWQAAVVSWCFTKNVCGPESSTVDLSRTSYDAGSLERIRFLKGERN